MWDTRWEREGQQREEREGGWAGPAAARGTGQAGWLSHPQQEDAHGGTHRARDKGGKEGGAGFF